MTVMFMLLWFFLCNTSHAVTDDTQNQTERRKQWSMEKHYKLMRIAQNIPKRFTGKLREDNLNDIEVRETVRATQSIFPGAIVNIDGVKTGCPCEEGSNCTAQVWVVSFTPDQTNGLMPSKINDH